MGWSACCVFINDREPGYLGGKLRHDSDEAVRLISDLGLGQFERSGRVTLSEGLDPEELTIGAYDGAAIIGMPVTVGGVVIFHYADPNHASTRRLIAAYPRAAVLVIMLQSTVDAFWYVYYEAGERLRMHSGSAEDGILDDVGAPLPEEAPYLSAAPYDEDDDAPDGVRPYNGEDIVFAMTERFFGTRLNVSSCWDLEMEVFKASR